MLSKVDLDLVPEALKKLSEKELKKMEHCVGFDSRKVYHRKGFAYFKPHRNYFDPGGTDCEIWAGIKKKGYAESGRDDQYYWLNKEGYNILSWYEQVYIYSENIGLIQMTESRWLSMAGSTAAMRRMYTKKSARRVPRMNGAAGTKT